MAEELGSGISQNRLMQGGPHDLPRRGALSRIRMMKPALAITAAGLAIAAYVSWPAVAGLIAAPPQNLPNNAAPTSMASEPITPIPLEVDLDLRKVELGRVLFNDSRLSGDKGFSCSTCHSFQRGLTDGTPLTADMPGHPGLTNTLTLFNIGLAAMFGWDGQTGTLEAQAEGVVKGRMGANWDDVTSTLKKDVGLTAAFRELYEDGLERDNIINALVEYEKSFITPNAPFDRFLRGDKSAISPEAKAGYRLFKDYGCASCHQGVNVGGNMLQALGIFEKPKAAAGGAKTPGAAQGTGIAEDKPVFRVPALRNVEYTAPYFHDGSVPTLSEAISIMARSQLGRNISQADIDKIDAFLKSLTGEFRGIPVGKL